MLKIKGSTKRPAYYKPPSRSHSFWRSFLRFTIVFIVILVVIIGAIFLYAWYSSQHDGGKPVTVSTTKPKPSIQPHHLTAPDAKVGVATQFVTSPVAAGDNASISIHTNDDANCTITVKYGGTTPATDSGLLPKTADDYGLVQWSWTIPAATPPTTNGSVDVWCADAKYNARVLETLVIQKPAAT